MKDYNPETMFLDKFKKGTNYKEAFVEEVDKLIKQDLTDDFKNVLIEALTDAYITQTGTVPDSYQLSRLTTWLVLDRVNDPHKVSKTEYPILSIDQKKLRQRRELVSESIEVKSSSSTHKMNGKRKPKGHIVFGDYEGV